MTTEKYNHSSEDGEEIEPYGHKTTKEETKTTEVSMDWKQNSFLSSTANVIKTYRKPHTKRSNKSLIYLDTRI